MKVGRARIVTVSGEKKSTFFPTFEMHMWNVVKNATFQMYISPFLKMYILGLHFLITFHVHLENAVESNDIRCASNKCNVYIYLTNVDFSTTFDVHLDYAVKTNGIRCTSMKCNVYIYLKDVDFSITFVWHLQMLLNRITFALNLNNVIFQNTYTM